MWLSFNTVIARLDRNISRDMMRRLSLAEIWSCDAYLCLTIAVAMGVMWHLALFAYENLEELNYF